MPFAGRQRFTRGDLFDLLQTVIFMCAICLFSYVCYLRLFIDIIHEPLSLEEGTLTEDNSLQTQPDLVLDRREEVRQAP